MLNIIVYFFFFDALESAILDSNCTVAVNGVLKYAPTAVNCPNILSDDKCLIIYQNAVAEYGVDDREGICYKDAQNKVDPELVQAAIDFCPKTCGYCCLTPEFNCEDKKSPQISCSAVTKEMCAHRIWRTILAEECPKTCGLCRESGVGCFDKIQYCKNDLSICHNLGLQTFVMENCRRTCGFCHTGTTRSPNTGACGSHPSCTNWIRNGFCTNTFYTTEQRRQHCGIPCGLC